MNQVGIGTRTLNFIVDCLAIWLISYIIYKINLYYAEQYKLQNVKFKYAFNFGYLYFIVLFGYYFICETIFAKTLGKIFSFTKVVNLQGKRANLLQILIRSLVRLTIIDMFFIPFLDKTLHDYLSKTAVVEA